MIKVCVVLLFFIIFFITVCSGRKLSYLEEILQKTCVIQGESLTFCPSERYLADVEQYYIPTTPTTEDQFWFGRRFRRKRETEEQVFESLKDAYCCYDFHCLYKCHPQLRLYKNAIVRGFPGNNYLLEELDKIALFELSPALRYRRLRNASFFARKENITWIKPEDCSFPKTIDIKPEDFEPYTVFLASQGRYFDEILIEQYPTMTLETRILIFSEFENILKDTNDFPNNLELLRELDWDFLTHHGMDEDIYYYLRIPEAPCKLVRHWRILVGAFKHHFLELEKKRKELNPPPVNKTVVEEKFHEYVAAPDKSN